ncbi:hypothetical protein BDV12DRAFT_100505 [Aspergillus spectabilis]
MPIFFPSCLRRLIVSNKLYQYCLRISIIAVSASLQAHSLTQSSLCLPPLSSAICLFFLSLPFSCMTAWCLSLSDLLPASPLYPPARSSFPLHPRLSSPPPPITSSSVGAASSTCLSPFLPAVGSRHKTIFLHFP